MSFLAAAALESPQRTALALALSYLVGSVPFGLLLARAKGVDLRKVGSGNIGATNVGRALGRPWAIVAFALDFLKGWIAVALFARIGGESQALAVACGTAAVLGHCFPIWLRFRGGKGVATGCGAIVALAPTIFLAGGVVWLLALALTRYVGLASIAMGFAFPVAAWIGGRSEPVIAGAALLALLILVRHRTNIARMLHGTEPRFGSKGAKGSHG